MILAFRLFKTLFQMFRRCERDVKLNPRGEQADFGNRWLGLIKNQHPDTNLNGVKKNHEEPYDSRLPCRIPYQIHTETPAC
jgi:hypothetical protein